MATLDDEAGELPGASSADGGREAAAGSVPPDVLAQGAAQEPELDVERKAVQPPAAREIGENVVLYGEPGVPADPNAGMTGTQRAIAQYRLEHPEATTAMIAAACGTDKGTVTKAMRTPAVLRFMTPILDAAGADLKACAEAVGRGLQAKKKTYATFEGNITDEREDPDHKVQLDAAKLGMEAHGALEEKAPVNINLVGLTDQQLAAIASGEKRVEDFIETKPS